MGRPKKIQNIDERLTADQQQRCYRQAREKWPECTFDWFGLPGEFGAAIGIKKAPQKTLQNRLKPKTGTHPGSFYHIQPVRIDLGGGFVAYFANTTSMAAGSATFKAYTSGVRRSVSGLTNVNAKSL